MVEIKQENKTERIDERTIKITLYTERTLTNQELYNEYARMKIELLQMEQQKINSEDTIHVLNEKIERIKKIISDLDFHAKEAEMFLDREKQLEEADKNGI